MDIRMIGSAASKSKTCSMTAINEVCCSELTNALWSSKDSQSMPMIRRRQITGLPTVDLLEATYQRTKQRDLDAQLHDPCAISAGTWKEDRRE